MQDDEVSDRLRASVVPPAAPVDVDGLWERAQRNRRRRHVAGLAAALVIVAIGVTGALALGGDGGTTVSTDVADEGDTMNDGSDDPPAGSPCGGSASEFVGPSTDMIVFLQPETPEGRIAELADQLESDPETSGVVVVGQDETFAEFRELFADSPEILDSVTADILPPRLEVDVDDEAAVGRIERELARTESVREVLDAQDLGRGPDACVDDPFSTETTVPETPSTTSLDAVTAEDEGLVDDFLRFAANRDVAAFERLRFADEVQLGLGPELVLTRPAVALADPEQWTIDVEYFRARGGPFSALDVAGDSSETAISIGDHPHCASPPTPAPEEVADLRRVSVQPDAADTCLRWWTVDLFVSSENQIAAVTLDLWEP